MGAGRPIDPGRQARRQQADGQPARGSQRPHVHPVYILSTGCQWAAIPKDLPPRSTLHDYFDRWDDDGTLGRIHHALDVACRELAGRDTSPSAAIIDSQSVKSAEKGGAALPRRTMTAARRSEARSVMPW